MTINTKVLRLQFISFLTWWKLLLDRNHQEEGPSCFESIEPNYLKSMFHALDFLLKTIDAPLTTDFILKLHSHAVGNTSYRYNVEIEGGIIEQTEPFSLGYRKNTGTEFRLLTSGKYQNCSEAGFIELLEKLENGDSYFYITVLDTDGNFCELIDSKRKKFTKSLISKKQLFQELSEKKLLFSIRASNQKAIIERMQSILNQYQQDIVNPDLNHKIRAITTCIHELEITHPFYDGNGRTFMLLLLNKLLIENNLSPTMLEYADRFDAFSIDELCEEVKKGQKFFQNCSLEKIPPKGILLDLDNNKTLTEIVAYQIATSTATWHDSPEPIKKEIITIVHEVLKTLSHKSFEDEQLQLLMNSIRECLVNSEISLNPVTVDLGKFRENLRHHSLLPHKFFSFNNLLPIFTFTSKQPTSENKPASYKDTVMDRSKSREEAHPVRFGL